RATNGTASTRVATSALSAIWATRARSTSGTPSGRCGTSALAAAEASHDVLAPNAMTTTRRVKDLRVSTTSLIIARCLRARGPVPSTTPAQSTRRLPGQEATMVEMLSRRSSGQSYVYALVDRVPRRWRPPAAGVGGGSVIAQSVHDLVLIVSPVTSPLARTLRSQAVHDDVVVSLMDAEAGVPLPVRTVLGHPPRPA